MPHPVVILCSAQTIEATRKSTEADDRLAAAARTADRIDYGFVDM